MRARFTALLLAALAAGCGYVGDPQPPALKIPAKITDFAASQIEDRIVIRFTVPELTLDGIILRRGKVDLRAGAPLADPFDADAWAAQAKPLDPGPFKPGPGEVTVPAAAWLDREVLFRARLLNDRGRAGEWSDLVTLRVVAPLETPAGLKAEAVPEGVRLSWTGPRQPEEVAFRILRRTGTQTRPEPVATASGLEWTDTSTRFGETYEYRLIAVLTANNARAESAPSEPVSIQPLDRFPPSVPKGLTVLVGPSSIELSWDPNLEPDLAGYYVYRSEGEGAPAKITELLASPHYSDKDVRSGARYRYAVSAADISGNESARSAVAEVILP